MNSKVYKGLDRHSIYFSIVFVKNTAWYAVGGSLIILIVGVKDEQVIFLAKVAEAGPVSTANDRPVVIHRQGD